MSSVEWFKRRLRDKHGVKEEENGERPQEVPPATALERGPGYDVLVDLHRTLSGHTGVVSSVAFSSDGKYVVSGSWDNTVRSWNPLSGAAIQIFSGKKELVYTPHTDRVNCVRVFPNSRYVLSGSDDKTSKIWDIKTGACLHTLGTGNVSGGVQYKAPVSAVGVSSSGKVIVSGLEDGHVLLWDVYDVVTNVVNFQSFEMGSRITALSFHPRMEYLAVGRDMNMPCAIQYDPKTQRYADIHDVHDARLPPYPAESLSFSPDGGILCQAAFEMHAQSSYTDILNLWETSDLSSADRHVMMRIQQPAGGSLSSVAFSTRHDLLASGSSDGMLRLWDLKRYVCVGEVKAHEKAVNGVACSSDGGLLATASSDKTVKLWKVKYA